MSDTVCRELKKLCTQRNSEPGMNWAWHKVINAIANLTPVYTMVKNK